jgi:hypothetical protein
VERQRFSHKRLTVEWMAKENENEYEKEKERSEIKKA